MGDGGKGTLVGDRGLGIALGMFFVCRGVGGILLFGRKMSRRGSSFMFHSLASWLLAFMSASFIALRGGALPAGRTVPKSHKSSSSSGGDVLGGGS